MEEQPKMPDANIWSGVGVGLLGMMGAAAVYLSKWMHPPLDPRLLNYVLATHEHFVGALVAIHRGEFGFAQNALATCEFYVNEALVLVPEHSIMLPDLPRNERLMVLRHDEDITAWQDWLRLEQAAITTKLCLRPDAHRCAICGRLAEHPDTFCTLCRGEACVSLATTDAVEARLAVMLAAEDERKAARHHEADEAVKARKAAQAEPGPLE